MRNKSILIHVGNTYNFFEFYDFFIKGLIKKKRFNIFLIIDSSFLNTKLSTYLDNLYKRKIITFYMINKFSDYSSITEKNNIQKILDIIKKNEIKLFLSESFSTLGLKSMAYLIKQQNGKNILLSYTTLNNNIWNMPLNNLKTNKILFKTIINPNQGYYIIKNAVFNFIKKYTTGKYFRLKSNIFFKLLCKKNLIIIDKVLEKKISKSNHFRLFSYLEDYIVCFDSYEKKMISKHYDINKIKIYQYPFLNIFSKPVSNDMLIIVPGPVRDSLNSDKVKRFINILKKIKKSFKINRINIRFHPRENDVLKLQFSNIFKNLNYSYQIINVQKKSIIDDFDNYKAIIGGVSSVFRTARNLSDSVIFIGIKNFVFDNYWGSNMQMGFANENLLWIEDEKDINLKNIIIKKKIDVSLEPFDNFYNELSN